MYNVSINKIKDYIMKKGKLIRKENININREILVYVNTIKQRIPIAPPGFAFKSKKQRIKNKRVKVTRDNWDRI